MFIKECWLNSYVIILMPDTLKTYQSKFRETARDITASWTIQALVIMANAYGQKESLCEEMMDGRPELATEKMHI